MTWFDNSGGFKAHKKHWVNKSRREGEEGRGTRWEEGVKGKEGGGRRKEGGGRRKEEGGGGRSRSALFKTRTQPQEVWNNIKHYKLW